MKMKKIPLEDDMLSLSDKEVAGVNIQIEMKNGESYEMEMSSGIIVNRESTIIKGQLGDLTAMLMSVMTHMAERINDKKIIFKFVEVFQDICKLFGSAAVDMDEKAGDFKECLAKQMKKGISKRLKEAGFSYVPGGRFKAGKDKKEAIEALDALDEVIKLLKKKLAE